MSRPPNRSRQTLRSLVSCRHRCLGFLSSGDSRVASPRFIVAFGIHPRTLYAPRDSGRIELLSRGLYRLADALSLGNPDLVTVALKIPNGVVYLISALAWHQLTTQILHEICVAIPSRGGTASSLLSAGTALLVQRPRLFVRNRNSQGRRSPRSRLQPREDTGGLLPTPESDRPRYCSGSPHGIPPPRPRQRRVAPSLCGHLSREASHPALSGGRAVIERSLKNVAATVRQRLMNSAAV